MPILLAERTKTSSAFDFHFVGHGRLRGRHGQRPAVADVELRAVPRASDRETIQLPFGQRAAVVRANVVDRVELAVDMKQRDQPLFDLDQLPARIGHFGHSARERTDISRLPRLAQCIA